MSKYTIRSFRHGLLASDLIKTVNLYNMTMIGVHGFHPVTTRQFEEHVLKSRAYKPNLFLVAQASSEIIGICHSSLARGSGENFAGSIEMIGVHPNHRKRGIGLSLINESIKALRRESVFFIDGGGTYPYSPCYSTLLDGSERSGPEFSNKAFVGLLKKCGFKRGRTSLIMRADLSMPLPEMSTDEINKLSTLHYSVTSRKGKDTWLDFVFRGWELFDSTLADAGSSEILTRAIFAFMPHLSAFEGKNIFAVFGVNTNEELRGNGLATIHFREIRKYLRSLNADAIELHVYEDNTPAVRLYQKSGFEEIGRTKSMGLSFK